VIIKKYSFSTITDLLEKCHLYFIKDSESNKQQQPENSDSSVTNQESNLVHGVARIYKMYQSYQYT
jgi:hypothetical protein